MVTYEDLRLILQQSIQLTLKIEVYDKDQLIGNVHGAVNGSMTIDANSDIRRTCNFSLTPTLTENIVLSEQSLLWLNKDIRLFLGIMDNREKKFVYFPLGFYVYTSTSGTYDAVTNQLTINCSDFMAKLDGTKNGQIGALTTVIPAYEENEETGDVVKYNIIRDVVITLLEQMCKITNYRIDDIGEHKALPEFNDDWISYRERNPQWNAIPFDQEFSCGASILSILTTFRDLYPNFEMFFEPEENTFICQTVPGCYEDDLFLDNSFLHNVLISENTTVDMLQVRNICEVWGQVIDTDFYTEDCLYADNVYVCNIEEFEDDYYNGDTVAIRINETNKANPNININGLGDIGIYDESTELEITENTLNAEKVYAFRIRKTREDKEDIVKAYLLGQWQAHGMNALVDGTTNQELYTTSYNEKVPLYSVEYFRDVYECESVELTIVPDSPFTVQKLGEILDVKTGGEYENITSDALALERARWENWKNCRLTDNITINTSLLPFLDVNKKVSYLPHKSDYREPIQFITNTINHDLNSFTSTITMYRFYPLYETEQKETGTHRALSGYKHGVLGKYTHEQLLTIFQGKEI